jgi:hypothetical protein
MQDFSTEYIKKLIDEAGRRCIKALSYDKDRLSLEFYPNAQDAVELPATKATVKVPGGPLGLGLVDDDAFTPETVQFPGPAIK